MRERDSRPERDREPRALGDDSGETMLLTNETTDESDQGGSEILESLGYTEYTGFALQFPRTIIPDMFADHIGDQLAGFSSISKMYLICQAT